MCYPLFRSVVILCVFFFFKQKTAYEMRSSDWSSDVCSSDLGIEGTGPDNSTLTAGSVRLRRNDNHEGRVAAMPTTTSRARVMQRVRIGLTGLACVFLLVLIGTASISNEAPAAKPDRTSTRLNSSP